MTRQVVRTAPLSTAETTITGTVLCNADEWVVTGGASVTGDEGSNPVLRYTGPVRADGTSVGGRELPKGSGWTALAVDASGTGDTSISGRAFVICAS